MVGEAQARGCDHQVRIQRSYVVNLDPLAAIELLDPGDAGVHSSCGARQPCSPTYRDELRQRVAVEA